MAIYHFLSTGIHFLNKQVIINIQAQIWIESDQLNLDLETNASELHTQKAIKKRWW